MRTTISRSVLIGIRRISADLAPREACGLLFGEPDAITDFQVVENVSETPETHFEIDPSALFAAQRAERAGGAKLLGYWHSHPSGDARPSARDAEMAALDGKLWLIAAQGRIALWHPVENTIYGSTETERHVLRPVGTVKSFRRVAATTDDVRDLVPHTKGDAAMVPLIAEAGYPAIAPILDQLLEWIADGNWPIAPPLADYLATLGEPIVAPIRRILQGDDGQFKFSCLSMLVRELDGEAQWLLIDEVERLGERPSADDRENEVDMVARELLETWRDAAAPE